MDKLKINYRPLTGRAGKLLLFSYARYRLWAAEDHLLNMVSKEYSESCKRFYLNDIQAIVITRTRTGRLWNIILAILLLLAALAVLIIYLSLVRSEEAHGPEFILAPLVALPLIGLINNVILGPTCKTRLYTAVQVEELAPLSRLRTAEKVVDELKPMIEAAQGRLTPESLDASSAESVAAVPAASAGAAAPLPFAVTAPAAPEIRHERGDYHAAFLAMTLIFGLSAMIDIFWQHHIKNLLDTILLLPFLGLGVTALVKQRQSDLPPGVKAMPWLGLGFLLLTFLFMVIYYPFFIAVHPELIESMLRNGRMQEPVFLGFLAVEAVVYSSLALIGLLRLNRFQAAHAAVKTGAGSAGTGAADG
jgi:hypothetical protein